MRVVVLVLATLAAMLACMPRRALAVERYEGLAYRLGSAQLAYREEHWRYDAGGVASRLVLYRCPGGAAFARKLVRDHPSAMAPDFEFFDARDGHRAGVRTQGGRREGYWQERADAPARHRALALSADTVVDAGFDALVRAHWPALATATPLRARFLLPGRFAQVPVRLQPLASPGAAARGELGLALGVDAWYGFAAPGTRLFYRERDRWLARFEGPGSIRDARGRYLPVRIEFPDRLRVVAATPAQLRQALEERLDGRCRT